MNALSRRWGRLTGAALLTATPCFADATLNVGATAGESARTVLASENVAQALQAAAEEGPPAPPTPEPEPEQAAPPPAAANVAASNPAAANAAPSWLAPTRAEPAPATSSSGLSLWVVVLSLIALGAAFWFQRKRLAKQSPLLGDARIRTLASSRVGPRAHAVAVEFGGKVFLLGVTDTQVSCLETLSAEEVSLHLARGEKSELEVTSNDDLRERATLQQARVFRAHLENSLTQQAARGAAEELAEQLSDPVKFKSRTATELVDVEGQAAGLAARLRNTVGQPKRTR